MTSIHFGTRHVVTLETNKAADAATRLAFEKAILGLQDLREDKVYIGRPVIREERIHGRSDIVNWQSEATFDTTGDKARQLQSDAILAQHIEEIAQTEGFTGRTLRHTVGGTVVFPKTTQAAEGGGTLEGEKLAD